ncbi:hypothetical protein [Micromonospora wenchangensis]|uniref:hypothetical protein n=1 Tax=Micromonospora wenchangensis TaxID=1185415 RepID=UPI001181D11B|nr:hypothetical protein [Micromonospora wenchangensis]
MTEQVKIIILSGVIAGAMGVVANWVPRPDWFKQWAVGPSLAVLVAGSCLVAFCAGRSDAPGAVAITRPAHNSQVPQRNTLEGVVQRDLPQDHQIWFDVHADEEQLYHFAEKECSVIDEALNCPELVVGEPTEPPGKRFVVTIYDCDTQAVGKLLAYARRVKTGDTKQDYAGQPRPTGCNAMAANVVTRS